MNSEDLMDDSPQFLTYHRKNKQNLFYIYIASRNIENIFSAATLKKIYFLIERIWTTEKTKKSNYANNRMYRWMYGIEIERTNKRRFRTIKKLTGWFASCD